LRSALAIALADFRDRVRRRSFLAVLALAGVLGLQTIQGNIEVSFGRYTGAPTSAWAGILMAMVASTFLGLVGFWAVKGSLERDALTGVGQILAATPVSRLSYTLGKGLSNFGVLAAMCGVLALSAFALLLVSPQREPIEPLQILLPLVLLALPGLAVVAACAVLFETIGFLARGFGNLVWFVVWIFLLVGTMESKSFDLFGTSSARDLLGEEVRQLDGTWSGSFVIGSSRAEDRASEIFRWERLPVSPHLVGARAGALGIAVLVAIAAALPFDRFDPARRRLRERKRRRERDPSAVEAAGTPPAVACSSLPRLAPRRTFGLWRLAGAELLVALRSMPRWWLLGAAVTTIGGLISGEASRSGWIAAAFLWPSLLWSALVTRDRAHGVAALLQAAPATVRRQLPAVT
jgi:hypothetical protein